MAQMRSIQESEFRDGAWNMAVDSAIAAVVAAREQPPTLRLYGLETVLPVAWLRAALAGG